VTAYALGVVAGRVVAGRFVRLACERHLRDLEEGPARGLQWSPKQARYAIGYFQDVLRLSGGPTKIMPFVLTPSEAFVVGSLFGWLGADGFRRFRTAYVEVGKGWGKSPLAAGIGLLMQTADGEQQAEVYSGAAKKDQAMILFRDAVSMVARSPALDARMKRSGGEGQVWNLYYLPTESFFRPISSDDAQSGPRPHCGLIDELHEHKDATVVDMMRLGTKNRRQALIFEITNSGFDRHSVCYQHHEYSVKVLEGVIAADTWFAFVAGLDVCDKCRGENKTSPTDGCPECDDWRDERVWLKANPNLGVTLQPKYLREVVEEAKGMPAKQNTVKRLNFCIWTENLEKAIPVEWWDLGGAPIDVEALRGRPCVLGAHLASVSELSACALLFPPTADEEPVQVLPFFWVPEADMLARASRAGATVTYDDWVRAGYITVTPGNTTDFGAIRKAINELTGQYGVSEVVFPHNFGGQILADLQRDLGEDRVIAAPLAKVKAGTAELLRLVKGWTADRMPDGRTPMRLQHGGHPVLRWNASNLCVRLDTGEGMAPDLERSQEQVKGVTALINAIARWMEQPDMGTSVYDVRDPLEFDA
jgi:phage terminase large subunit-like protein